MYKVLYFDTHAKYYQEIGEYMQASDYIDTTLTMLKKDFTSDYAEQLLEKARIWKQAEQSEKAIPLYEQALAIKDSAATVLSNTQMEQIKKQIPYRKNRTGTRKAKQQNPTKLSDFYFCYSDFAIYLHGTAFHSAKSIEALGKRNTESNRKRTENK